MLSETQATTAAAAEAELVRTFPSGATRDTSTGKHEYARFMDPRVIRAYGAFMTSKRRQSDGTLRDPDNWKKGMPLRVYMDSLWRHLEDLWEIHEYGSAIRPETGEQADLVETLCAIMFNSMGYLFEVLRGKLPPGLQARL